VKTRAGRRRLLLWMKLAAFAAVGVVAMHAVHLAIGNRVASAALLDQQEALGRDLARLVARQAADPILVNDPVTLQELVEDVVQTRGHTVSYCLVVRGDRVLASSYPGETPRGLVSLRAAGGREAIVVRSGTLRVLDVAEPILGGQLGEVRLGLDTSVVTATRRELAVHLGLLALAVIGAGLLAAFLLGRTIARPVNEMLVAADQFDPAAGEARGGPAVRPSGSDEIAELADRFNQMMRRLEAAHAEQQQARQKAIETERLAALGSLVAGVAHEVNNPLAGLKNCLRRLERGDLSPEKAREYLALMEEGLERIEAVVRQLLDFGRPSQTVLEPVPARTLADEATRLLAPLLHPRRITCRVDADAGADDAEKVRADRRQAGQALVNLLLNAVYVTPDGGQIRVRLVRRDRFVGVAVEDDGPGIPAEVRDRILDPFFSTKPEGEGTGLGLSVTRTIVDAHGGELSFDFPPRGGTVATVWLPAA
jgi:two-component system, NtrC family, sensor kinase